MAEVVEAREQAKYKSDQDVDEDEKEVFDRRRAFFPCVEEFKQRQG